MNIEQPVYAVLNVSVVTPYCYVGKRIEKNLRGDTFFYIITVNFGKSIKNRRQL